MVPRLNFGAVGLVLLVGCLGAEGPRGPQGVAGSPGNEGDAGVAGAMGSMGPGGPVGPVGPVGDGGPVGDAGPVGRDIHYVGPGLRVSVLDAGVVDGGAAVDLLLTDAEGRLLERTGAYTEGAVSLALVLGFITERSDGLVLEYQSYTRRSVPADGGTVVQNATDTGGRWTELEPLGSGRYRYEFATPVVVGANAGKTHSVGLYATRTFRGTRFVDNQVFHFRPDGQSVTVLRDLVTNAGCETCHTRLEAHGGARRDVALCVMCHTDTNDIDPESGNSVDFKTMIHKIHRGAQLPSVVDGGRYRLVGFQGAVHDYSEVVYPGNLNDCDVCHAGSDGARWKTNPSSANCLGCHDRTWFSTATPPAGYTVHPGGPRNDAQCVVCHAPNSISPIEVKHALPDRDPRRLAVASSIVSAPATAPGAVPSFTFTVSVDGQPREVLSQRLSRLRVVVGGPNTDVERYWSETAENAADCASVTDGGACLTRVDAGVFTYRAATALRSTDQGSFTVGLEVCATDDAGVRWCAQNPVAPFAVTDAQPVARRQTVTQAQCNQCHQSLAAHGGTRTTTTHCTVCHGVNLVSSVPVPTDGGVVTAPAANFKDLIHRAHQVAAYPTARNDCSKCHTPNGWSLPLPATALPSRSELRSCGLLPDGGPGVPDDGGVVCLSGAVVVSPLFLAPVSAACTSCHGGLAAQAHAALNTTATGLEACAVCHAAGRTSGVDVVHAVGP